MAKTKVSKISCKGPSSKYWKLCRLYTICFSTTQFCLVVPQLPQTGASPVVLGVKNPPANAGDLKDTGSIPGSGRSPGGGHSSPLQYICLENPMDKGDWWATVHRVTKSQTWLKQLSTHPQWYLAPRIEIIPKLVLCLQSCCRQSVDKCAWPCPINFYWWTEVWIALDFMCQKTAFFWFFQPLKMSIACFTAGHSKTGGRPVWLAD